MELEGPDHGDAPDPKGHSNAVPQRLLRGVVIGLVGLVVAGVVVSMIGGGGDKALVADQAELEKSIEQIIAGIDLDEPSLAGLPDSCIPTTTQCGDVLVAAFEVGAVDEVCDVVDAIAASHDVTEIEADECAVVGTVNGHTFLAKLGPATVGMKGFPLLLAIV